MAGGINKPGGITGSHEPPLVPAPPGWGTDSEKFAIFFVPSEIKPPLSKHLGQPMERRQARRRAQVEAEDAEEMVTVLLPQLQKTEVQDPGYHGRRKNEQRHSG